MRGLRTSKRSGFTVADICISLIILALIVGASIPLISRYRGRTAVNRGVEVCKAVIDRALEEAKTSGSPLPSTLKSGLTSAAQPNSPADTPVSIRIRKRIRPSTTPILVTEKNLSTTAVLRLSFNLVGMVDIDADQSLTGVYVEFVAKPASGPPQLLATIPIDINGEIALIPSAASATLVLDYNNYQRSLELTPSGSVVLDRH